MTFQNRFEFAGDHVVGPDGNRFSFDWAIEQLHWREPPGPMPMSEASIEWIESTPTGYKVVLHLVG